jgi:preprotein translocase subunit SecG
MAIAISILIILCCLVLVLAVLIQNPKGGGLASGFQGGSQVMGVRRTADFLEKATWTLAILLFIFSVFATSYTKKGSTTAGGATSTTKERAAEMEKNNKPGAPMNFGNGQNPGQPAPAAPAPQPK